MISLGSSRGIFIQLMSLDMPLGKQGSTDRGNFIIWQRRSRGLSWQREIYGKYNTEN